MKKLLLFFPVLIVFGLFLLTYRDYSKTLKDQEYVKNMMSNIDISYQITVKQMQYIRESFLQMNNFFEQDSIMIGETYEHYYEILQQIQEKMDGLHKYTSSLENYCAKIGIYHNNQCSSFVDNVSLIKDDYNRLVEKYNDVIRQYNINTNSNLNEV